MGETDAATLVRNQGTKGGETNIMNGQTFAEMKMAVEGHVSRRVMPSEALIQHNYYPESHGCLRE